MKLDPQQITILDIKHGIHAVQAPAGCGKTEILTQRIGNAILNGVNEEQIICLTFTNKAAAVMKERYLKDGLKFRGFIGNFHNYCREFLGKNNLISGRVTLMGEDDFDDIIEGIIRKNKTAFEINKSDFIKYIMDFKRTKYSLDPIFKDEFRLLTNQPVSYAFNQLYEIYESIKLAYNFIDFDDLLTLTIYYLKRSKNLIFNRFEWIQIDETQDLNLAQWEIINLISLEGKCVVYFGDFEQSIYSFLGTEEGRFSSLFNKTQVTPHFLTNNYRSTPEVISVLNTFLKNTIKSKVCFSNNYDNIELKSGKHFRVFEMNGTHQDELEFVASYIVKPQLDNLNKIGILCRTKKSVDLCGKKLSDIGIDCFKLSGVDLFKDQELKLAFASLNSILNPFDILSWSLLLKSFNFKLELQDARKLIHKALSAGLLPKDLLGKQIKSQYENFCFSYENERIVVFDTETTSLDTDNGEIIQIAAIELFNGKIGNKFEVYIKPRQPISQEIIGLTKITNEKLQKDGIEPYIAIKEFINFLGDDCTILAHNLDYDISILSNFIGKYSEFPIEKCVGTKIDSLIISKLLYPELAKYKLGYLLSHFNLEGNNSHNAMDDVLATISLVRQLYIDATNKRNIYQTFTSENQVILKEFRQNYFEIYTYLNNNYYESVQLTTVIDHIINLNSNSKIIDKPIYNEFLKYSRNLERSYNFKSLRMRLQEDFQHLKSLKESDLINDSAKVVVSTVHKSKGLSFDQVIVVDSVYKSYPSYRATIEKDELKKERMIAEDKRLFYVAISRAKKNIVVTYHNEFISQYGNTYPVERTPFLEPIKELFEIESY